MQCSCIQEENVQLIIPANHNYWKETKAALIEKERRKAEALARRQTRRLCLLKTALNCPLFYDLRNNQLQMPSNDGSMNK